MMRILKSNRGSILPLGITALFFVLCLVALLYANQSVDFKISSVYDAMQTVAEDALVKNSEASFYTKREAFTGAFDGSTDTAITIDPKPQLIDMLGLTQSGTALVKLDDTGSVLYSLEDVVLTVTNTAPTDESMTFTATLTATLSFELKYPLIDAAQISIPISTTAKNDAKF